LRRYLTPEADLGEGGQRAPGILLLDQEVDVVVDRLAAAGVHREAAGEAERDAGLLQLERRPFEGGDQRLALLGNGHRTGHTRWWARPTQHRVLPRLMGVLRRGASTGYKRDFSRPVGRAAGRR